MSYAEQEAMVPRLLAELETLRTELAKHRLSDEARTVLEEQLCDECPDYSTVILGMHGFIERLMEERAAKREPPRPNPVVAICGECRLELRRVMNYVCNKLNCPVRELGPPLTPSEASGEQRGATDGEGG